MSESISQAPARNGGKVGKLFLKKEERGISHASTQQVSRKINFFSGIQSHAEDTAGYDNPDLQAFFNPGIQHSQVNIRRQPEELQEKPCPHLFRKQNDEEEIQRLCEHCEEEKKVQKSSEEDKEIQKEEVSSDKSVQKKCTDCEKEEKLQRYSGKEYSGVPDKDEEKLQREPEKEDEEKLQRNAEDKQESKDLHEGIQTPPPIQQACAECKAEKLQPKLSHNSTPHVVQASLKVGAPDDPYEKEADQMAEKVMSLPEITFSAGESIHPGNSNNTIARKEEDSQEKLQSKPIKPVPGLQRSADGGLHTSPGFTSRLNSSLGGGSTISAPVRIGMESAFNADFTGVRIHSGSNAAGLSSEIGAQAFTYRNNIFFNENKYNPDTPGGRFLLAHELTHTVQQGASKTVQRDPEPTDTPTEEESWLDKLKKGFDATLKFILPTAIYNFYTKIKNGGILGYIKETILGLFKGLFGKLGFSEQEIVTIFQTFATLKSQIPAIIAGLSNNDCKPLFAALNLLSEVLGTIAGRIWDKLMEKLEPIRLWLIDIWHTYAAPVIDKITSFFGEQWELLKSFGRWIWENFYKPIIAKGKAVWDWIVKKLGFGSDDEPGLMSWVSNKLSEAWQYIKTELKPIIDPINDVIEGIKSLVSLDAIRKLQEDAKKWLDEVVKTATAMGSDEDAVANKQLTLRSVLLPALNKAIDRLKAALASAGNWVLSKVNYVADNVIGFVNGLQGNTYLRPMYSFVKWIPKIAGDLKDWASDKVNWLFGKIQIGVDHLRNFIEPIITLLEKIVSVVGNVLKYLPDLILGPLMFAPRCIKDPIIKWLTEVILKKIPLIGEFIGLVEKWEQIKTAALTVLKQVFLDGQLGKGLWTFFKTLLDILGIDPQLVLKVVAKAAQNFSDIISAPVAFFKNVWTAIKGGFNLFWDNILIHLPMGALEWLFGEVKGAVKVSPPKDFSVSAIFGFILELFGITLENVYSRMEKNPRIGAAKVAIIRKIEKTVRGVLEWVSVWINEGPEGLLRKVKEQIGDLKNMVIDGVVSWITKSISAAILKKLATSADPLGIGATINTIILIYDTIKTAIAYVNRMLNMLNSVMDSVAEIIAGNTKAASEYLETVFAKAVPFVIGFAVEVIIGPIGEKIKEIVTGVRTKIDEGIDWLINSALDFIGSLIDTGKKVVSAVLGWLGLKKEFTLPNGDTHELSFQGNDESAQLMIASKIPKPFHQWVSGIKITNPDTDAGKNKAKKKDKAIEKAKEIDNLKAKKVDEKFTDEEKTKQLKKLLDELSEFTGPLFAGLKPDCASEANAKLKYGSLYRGMYGSSMNAEELTNIKMPQGSEPNVSNHRSYSIINQRRSGKGGGSYYVQGHLLNHNLGGTGLDWKNLTPITRSANGMHVSLVESLVKKSVDEGNIINYSVTAKYGRTSTSSLENAVDQAGVDNPETVKEIIREEVNVPTALSCHATLVNPDNDSKVTLVNKDISNTIDQRPEGYDLVGIKRENIYLNSGDPKAITSIGPKYNMNLGIAYKIVKAMDDKLKSSTRFDSYNSLAEHQINGVDVFSPTEKPVIRGLQKVDFVKLY